MSKKVLMLVSLFFCIVLISGCSKEKTVEDKKNDAIKFKEEYESLNGKKSTYGSKYRNVSISKSNPFVYISAEDVVSMVEDNKTFYIYFGDKQCPWCRSVIEKMIEVANDYEIDKIYYVNIWDDEHNEILRDKYTVNNDGNPELVNKGTKAYYKLLEYFNSVLDNYELTDKNGNLVEVGEKRIFAPNLIYIKEGNPIKLVDGISSKQDDPLGELTDEILKDQESQFIELFTADSMCYDKC